jgi:hypothetical protein
MPRSLDRRTFLRASGAASGLPWLAAKTDGIHFDSPALREFGKRYAVAMQKLHAATK